MFVKLLNSNAPSEFRRLKLSRTVLLVCIITFGSSGCLGIADLRTDAIKNQGIDSDRMTQDGRRLLTAAAEAAGLKAYQTKLKRGETLTLIVTDSWSSSLLRGFTPLPANQTRLQLVIRPGPITAIEATATDIKTGSQDAALRFGIKGGAGYFTNPSDPDENRAGADATDVKIYLESLWLYLSLPLHLAFKPQAAMAAYALPTAGGPASRDREWDRVFVSPGGAEPSPERDQYILWLDPRNNQTGFVEFTYREVFEFYSGALYYSDLRAVDGVIFPHEIKVTDGIDDPESVHTIQIESAEFGR